MKQLLTLVLWVPLLSVWGCAPPPAPVQATPTTTAFDGTYFNPLVSAKTPTCPTLDAPPPLTISNGSALWQGPNLKFQGSVTPQGVLTMDSGTGQTFQGQITPQFVLNAHVAGPNCAYNITLNRVS